MHLVQILLPLYDNGGTPIPQLQFRRVSQEMADRFGGLTAFTRAPAEGVWKEGGQKTSHDEIVVFEVIRTISTGPGGRAIARSWSGGFRQEVIVIRAQAIEQL